MITFAEKLAPEHQVEVAAVGDDSFARSLGYYTGSTQLNPDPILRTQAGGLGIDLYKETIRKDAQIYADMRTRRKALVGLDWEIVPAGADARDVAAAEFVGAALLRVPGFTRDLYELTDAIGMGYAVSEILWGPTRDGRIGIVDIRSRHQRRFVFGTQGQLRLLTDRDLSAGTSVPPRKFLVHSFEGEHENPYGTGVCQALYWYAWFSRNAIKFWALYTEKFGAPTPVGKYPPGSDDSAKRALLSALNAIQQETAVVIPDTMSAEFLEAQRRGSIDTYRDFLTYLDQKKSQIVLGQTLTSGQGDGTGSYALGRVHADVRQDILEGDAASLADVINGQLIPWLVDWNFLVTDYPQFVFNLERAEDLRTLALRDRTLQIMGTPIPKSYIQRKYGIPEPAGEDDVLTSQALAAAELGAAGGADGGDAAFGEFDRAFEAADAELFAAIRARRTGQTGRTRQTSRTGSDV
jgi:phage gp29-like protein